MKGQDNWSSTNRASVLKSATDCSFSDVHFKVKSKNRKWRWSQGVTTLTDVGTFSKIELSSEAEFLLGNLMAVLGGILIEIIKLKFTNSF